MSSLETVTVLITDLVGSTGLAHDLGPDAADELRREHFGALRDAVKASGGHEVKNTGDGLMVVFRGAAGAVACAVAMQQRIERRNRRADQELAIRIGIGLGDATAEDGDYFGMPVVEAARLCDRAAGGQILTTDLVRVIGGREGAEFAPVGSLELSGIPRPVPTFSVEWAPDGGASDKIPLPSRLVGVPAVGYVGRVEERERAKRGWRSARAGLRQALLVSGEPGVGKTRFTTHASLDCHAEGAVVLCGHCAEEVSAPYGAWIQALSHFVEHAPGDVLATHAERHGGELTRIAPGLARRMPQVAAPAQTDPETERYLLFSAVVGLLEQATIDSPVVLLLDDLHWADGPTLALLKHVLAETDGLRLLVLGTYRDTDLSRDHPLTGVLADLRREDGVDRLALRGLGEPEVRSIVEAVVGHELDTIGRELVHEITSETDGNPFFVGEILRHLSESGALVQGADGRWELVRRLEELGLPQSVREVVGRRVDRLGEDCLGVLSAAAVIGRDFDLELLVSVTGHDEDRLVDVLDTATEASLVQERPERTGSFSFVHNLINHTLYDVLGVTRRARLHRRVAEALEDLCGDDPGPRVAELARHWSAATTPVDASKALGYSKQAGHRALAELAPDEAVGWFARALELLDQAPAYDLAESCELMIGLGEAQRQAGRPEFRDTLLDAGRIAEELGDAERMSRAALANNRGFASTFGVVDQERVGALRRASERDRDPARRARLLGLEAMELQFDPDHTRRRSLADEALALAREAGDERVLPYVLRDHFHATWCTDTLDARRRTAMEMAELAERLEDPLAGIWALDRSIHVAAESGALRDATEASGLLLARTQQVGQPGLRWHATYFAAGLAQMRGELREAERLADAARELGEEAGEPDTPLINLGLIGLLRSQQGRGDEMVEILELGVAQYPGVPGFEAGLCAVLCDVGRGEEAASRLERAVDRGFAGIARNQGYSTALAVWARVAADTGSRRAAAPLYDLILPWRDLVVWYGSTGYGAAEMYLGLLAATLGAHDRAIEHFDAASRLHRTEGFDGWEAENLCGWASCLLDSGDAGGARAKADEALALAGRIGQASMARDAEALLRVGLER